MNKAIELKLKATAASLPKMCKVTRYRKINGKVVPVKFKDIDHLREIRRRHLHFGMEGVAKYQNEVMRRYKLINERDKEKGAKDAA